MDEVEKKRLNEELVATIQSLDAKLWSKSLLTVLHKESIVNATTPFLDFNSLISDYRSSQSRLVLLDYDGTLTPIVAMPEAARPSERTIQLLTRLCADPKNSVFVVSGRDQKSLKEWLGGVRKLGLCAEHGCFVKEIDCEEWEMIVQDDREWRQQALQVFEWFTERTFGSFIEEKVMSITWHYRRADPDFGPFQAAECLNRLSQVFNNRVDILTGKKTVEVRPLTANKGQVVKSILKAHEDIDFLFCAGDDTTDEDMFEVLSSFPSCYTCTIGSQFKRTRAKYHVNNPEQILSALESLM